MDRRMALQHLARLLQQLAAGFFRLARRSASAASSRSRIVGPDAGPPVGPAAVSARRGLRMRDRNENMA
ncbi:hypothetical protein L559_2251 [Bordetella pertussis STO1-CHOC-0017]|nr:hypothetical protein L559_2251 [Bordetella pertussis STO1-CHOC-0017]